MLDTRIQNPRFGKFGSSTQRSLYDWFAICAKYLIFLAIPLGGAKGVTIAYIALLVWTLGGPRRSIEALTLTWLLGALNPGIYAFSTYGGILRWIILATAFLSVLATFISRRAAFKADLYWLIAFVAISAILAIFFSYAPDISLFKLATFFLGAATILMAFQLTAKEADYWTMWFIALMAVVTLASFPLIISSVGYFRNGRGFQGLLNHPQTYAVFLAPFVAYLCAFLFDSEKGKRRNWLVIPLLALAVVSIFATQGRTGVLAALLSLSVIYALAVLRAKSSVQDAVLLIIGIVLVAPIIISTLWLGGDLATEYVRDFMMKNSGADSVAEAFSQSRGAGVASLWSNFLNHPLVGIGFGVPSDISNLQVVRDPILGLPISAPVEKGFAFVAIFEEVGVIGVSILAGLLVRLISPLFVRRGNMAVRALGLTALFTNFGEAIFFSFGGNGMLVWLLICAAVTISQSADST